MKAQVRMVSLLGVAAVAALAITIQLTAQESTSHKPKHHQYRLYDVGTFGGPNSFFWQGYPFSKTLSSQGTVVGAASTPASDPFYPNCAADCFVDHAFKYEDGVLTDLGSLGASSNSAEAHSSNQRGWIVGVGENGAIDPSTGFPELRAVLWKDGTVNDLGTFGGNISYALDLNNRGQVVGTAENSTPDSYAMGIVPLYFVGWPVATQVRAFLWQKGVMQDLGTLGGNDAAASLINDRGQVAGVSYTNTIPNATTGYPTEDPFFWQNRKMVDIGSLGGDFGYPRWMNSRGQVVGSSLLAGDNQEHGFLWDQGVLTDLGTLGGSVSGANWINDHGKAVGSGYLTGDSIFHAVTWKNGNAIDLGVLSGYPLTEAFSINNREQIVGGSATLDQSVIHAALWEDGDPGVDLNALVTNNSNATLQIAYFINDRGEIVASGALSNGDTRAFLLVPDSDCDDDCEQRIAQSQNHPAAQHASPAAPIMGGPAGLLRNRLENASPSPVALLSRSTNDFKQTTPHQAQLRLRLYSFSIVGESSRPTKPLEHGRPIGNWPETGFWEPWAGSAFDGNKLPITRLLARVNGSSSGHTVFT